MLLNYVCSNADYCSDIIAGLEMVHSEVGAFGGDPGRVTLMGHSQGASIAVVFAVSRYYYKPTLQLRHSIMQQLVILPRGRDESMHGDRVGR